MLRFKMPGHAAGYHVVTRVRGREFRLDEGMKDFFARTLTRLKSLYYVRVAAFAVMDSHYHLLVQFADTEDVDPREALGRWNEYHEDTPYCRNELIERDMRYVVRQLTDVSSFMKRLNQLLTRCHNRITGDVGTLWESRFRSVIVERGWSLLNCAAYIELNGFRASLSSVPEDYKHCSLSWLKRGNPSDLVDRELLDEGLGVSARFERVADRGALEQELYATYLAFVYEAGIRPHDGDVCGPDTVRGPIVTQAMRKRLARYEVEERRGAFMTRSAEHTAARFTGSYEFVRSGYERSLCLGYRGKARTRHMGRWLRSVHGRIWAAISTAASPQSLSVHSRGSP